MKTQTELTDVECDDFRRLPCINQMIRAAYNSGRADEQARCLAIAAQLSVDIAETEYGYEQLHASL